MHPEIRRERPSRKAIRKAIRKQRATAAAALRSVAVVSAAFLLAACAARGGSVAPASDGRPPPANAVQAEMRLLEEAMITAVRAFGEGDLSPIPPALHRVHEAKDATAAAIESGTYRPPKNPEALDAFVAMDEAFHDRLVELVRASREGDVERAGAAMGAILQGCDACHDVYRR